MTIEIATEQCECTVPKKIGYSSDFAGESGGTAHNAFMDATPEGYHIWSGPFRGGISLNESGKVTVNRNAEGNYLIVEYAAK